MEQKERTEKRERFNVPALEFPILTANTPICSDSILKWCMHVPTYTWYISSRMHVITAAAPYSQTKARGYHKLYLNAAQNKQLLSLEGVSTFNLAGTLEDKTNRKPEWKEGSAEGERPEEEIRQGGCSYRTETQR